jgi:hypothetical protein
MISSRNQLFAILGMLLLLFVLNALDTIFAFSRHHLAAGIIGLIAVVLVFAIGVMIALQLPKPLDKA